MSIIYVVSPWMLFLVINFFVTYCSTSVNNITLVRAICLGKSVVLECKCEKVDQKRWLFRENVLYVGTRLQASKFSRTLHLLGDYSLNISSVELENEGIYKCLCNQTIIPVYELIVEAPPDLYVSVNAMQNNDGIYFFESGKYYSIFCYGEDAKPPVNLTWLLNDRLVDHSYVNFSVNKNPKKNNLTYDSVTRLTFQSKEEFGNITCVSKDQCILEGQRERISFQTYVVPNVSLSIAGLKYLKHVYLEEKQNVLVNCTAKAARPVANLTLNVDEKTVENSEITMLEHRDFNLFDTSIVGTVYPTAEHETVTCKSRGEFGYEEEVITVNISTYAISTFKVTVNGKQIANGSRYYTSSGNSILVRCQAFGARPAVHLNWTITGEVLEYFSTQDVTSKDNTTQTVESEISLHLLPGRGKVTITCIASCHPGIPQQNYQIEIFTKDFVCVTAA